jgi:putative ABC transport system permease protein
VLIGTGLLLRTFLQVRQVDPGFRPQGVLTYQIFLPRPDYKEPAKTLGFFARLLSATGAVSGVSHVAAVSDLPFSGNDLTGEVAAEGAPPPMAGASNPAVSWRIITPGYFAALGIRITRGRAFRDSDDAAAPGVVVVDRRLAQRLWPGRDPLGRRLSLRDWARSEWLTVVGVSAPVKHESLTAEPREQLYLPLSQNTRRMMSIVVRTKGNPAAVAGAVRRQVWQIAPDLPVVNLRTLDEIVATSTSRLSFNLWLFGTFAVVAVALAILGVYSLTSYTVAQRTREMAIRMALGASRAAIFRLVLRRTALLLLFGLVLGLMISLWLSGLLRSQLFGIVPSDPLTLVVASAVVAGLGILASFLPARRATQVDLSQAFGRE